MTWTSQSHPKALAAYALLSFLILSGVTWGTLSTLELEREKANNFRERQVEEQTRKYEEHVNQAVDRMDNYLNPILALEAARSYHDYITYASPNNIYLRDGSEIAKDTYIQASPLIKAELKPWIKIHFHVGPDDNWISPRLPDGSDLSPNAAAPVATEYDIIRYTAILESFKTHASYDLLQSKYSGIAERTEQSGYGSSTLPPEECEVPASNVVKMRQSPSRDETPDVRDAHLKLDPMFAVWLDGEEAGEKELVFIRAVKQAYMPTVKGEEVYEPLGYQGFLVDWPALREQLTATSRDLLKDISLVPMDGETLESVDKVIGSVSAGLTSKGLLTADIAPEPPGWSSTQLACAVAWVGTLLVLIAVGAGLHGLLSLTERRTQFTYAVTHELRTPLTTLRLYTDMLASGLVSEKDKPRYFNTLNDEAERLTDVVNSVLEYARVENKRSRLDEENVTVAELLERIQTQCDSRCSGAGKELVLDVNGMGPSMVRTDARLVCQLVSTLVDNACKYSLQADDPKIVIRAHSEGRGRFCLDVEDFGPGIDPNQRRDVFKPFRRGAEPDSHKPGGIGLGLALARDWAKLLGGSLELMTDRVQKNGACFRLTLPLQR